ncbi:alpha-hydroxy-acid oxidizing protein [Halobellus sp. GM3]|uniref:alpha-hydroxy-acid oxidizing protein n=1 Tax=Halobellus sp. GM3 TaxID=3458410 RepID=UPI00403DFF19
MTETESFIERREREIRTQGAVVPFEFSVLESTALESLPAEACAFVAGGAGSGKTKAANEEAFDDWGIRPRVFRDVADRTLECEIFGISLPAPVVLAPIGQQSMYDDQGELASVRAAGSLDVPFTLSTPSSYSIEAVADASPDVPTFFQLYWTADWDVTESLLNRAERAGYSAIVLTVDFQVSRWMPEVIRQPEGEAKQAEFRFANLESDPVAAPGRDEEHTVGRDRSVTWEDLVFLKERTELPIIVKGICHPDDAKRALEYGADGIVVSNHGGRQIDGAVSAVSALPSIVDVVDGDIPILFDSGIRSGGDIFKALALGADAVFLGRPYIYGLTLAGERGVYEVLHNVIAELDSVLGLAGYDDIRDLDTTSLV